MKRIIADCYAATQPDDRLWAKYMAEIERKTLVQLEEERKLRQEEKRAEDARQERVRQRAQKVANVFAKILRWGLWIVLLAAALSVAPWGLPLSQTSIIRTTLAVLAGLLGMFAFLNLMYSTPLDDVIKRVEKYIGKEVEQWLRNITQ